MNASISVTASSIATALSILITVTSIIPLLLSIATLLLSISTLLVMLRRLLVSLLVSSRVGIVISRLEACRLRLLGTIAGVLVATVLLSRRASGCRRSAVTRASWSAAAAAVVHTTGSEHTASAGTVAAARELRQNVGKSTAGSALPVTGTGDGGQHSADSAA